MNGRPHFLRGYADSIPSPADDCATCRGGKWPCETPAACGIAEPEPIKLPLFADDPWASAAIGIALVLALFVVLYLLWSGQ